MSTVKSSKNILVKLVAVVVTIVLVFGLAPVLDVADISLNVSAAEVPVYDSTLGSYTTSTDANGNTVLTAVPNGACGFRGWFKKDGTEVSYNASYTLPSGETALDYVPVFYNFNLVKKGSFEEYTVGTNMKKDLPENEIWEGICEAELTGGAVSDWTQAVISSDRARTGKNSLRVASTSTKLGTTYHDFFDLEPYTQYTLKFWYNLDPTSTIPTKYLSHVAVIGENMQTTVLGNSEDSAQYLAHKSYDETTGACSSASDWKEVEITFFTEENTKVRLVFMYVSKNSKGNYRAAPLYLDDVSLVKNIMGGPTYFNEDFSTTTKNWTISNEKYAQIDWDSTNERLKVEAKLTFAHAQSPALHLKKGAKYNLSFDLDLSGVIDKYVPKVSNGALVTDPSNVTEDNPNGYEWLTSENWINFILSTSKGSITQPYIPNRDSSVAWTITDINGISVKITHNGKTTSTGFWRYSDSFSNLDFSNPLKVNLSFTAPKTATTYFATRLNGLGTYYIDNFVITEDTKNIDYVDIIANNNAVKSKGTSIRTSGKQGMRYKTCIDKKLLTTDMPYGIRVTEYGTVAIKTDYLGESDLVLDGEYSYNGDTYNAKVGVAYSFNNKTNFVFEEDATSIDYTGVLMNISKANWTSDYTARAYLKYIDQNGETGTMYIEPSNMAVYPISKAAYSARNSKGEFSESEEVRTYLYEKILNNFTDKIINVSNDSFPIYNNFQGIRSTVYHGTIFFQDSHNRTYTDEQAATEMDRLVDTKVDNVRTRFASQWMWTDNGWNWDSDKMNAFYKWADMLQDRNISITLQAGWHLHDFMYFYDKWVATNKMNYEYDNPTTGHSSISEVNYLHGYNDAATAKVTSKYGEDANAAAITAAGKAIGLELTDEEYAHYSVAAARYGEWIKQALNALKAHGINNIEYLIPFTETGYEYIDPNTKTPIENYSYDEWTLMVIALNNALEKQGIRNNYKFIGPAQSLYKNANRLPFVEYLYNKIKGTDYEDLLDINAMHQYTQPNTKAGYEATVFEPYASYSLAEENFKYYNDVLTKVGVRNQEFWCDEYFAHAPDAKWWNNIGMQMTQFAAGMTAGINNGVNRFLTWQMFDCLWDSDVAHGTGIHDNSDEFSGGIHAVGTCPALVHVDGKNCPNGEKCNCTKNYNISSYVPRVTYYGINLIGKYMNNENADVFETEVIGKEVEKDGGVYVSAIKNDEGKTVILVVNTMPVSSSVDVNFEQSGIVSFNRYTYDPNEIVPSADATSIPSDKELSLNGQNSFYDIIPAQSFAIYVEGAAK